MDSHKDFTLDPGESPPLPSLAGDGKGVCAKQSPGPGLQQWAKARCMPLYGSSRVCLARKYAEFHIRGDRAGKHLKMCQTDEEIAACF